MWPEKSGLTREQRLDKTLLLLLRENFPLPLRAICVRQGLKITPYMRDLMQKLIDDGEVTGDMIQSNGFQVFFYRLTDAGRVTAENVQSMLQGETNVNVER